jgi:GntR family transcriptional regulator
VTDDVVEVDTSSPVPPYEQLRAQIAAMAASGVLSCGQPLPTVRQLAADLGLAPGTVARAYRELEQQQVIETKGRRGTFVAPARTIPRKRIEADLAAAAREFAARAQRLGVTPDAALRAVERAF